jgi:DNA-binding MurR/RpiR family transcriptional regulator
MARGRVGGAPDVEKPEAADLVERIRLHADSFTTSFRRVADYVAAHLTDLAFYPAARVAEEVGVSESVVIRFAIALGYNGYPEMQQRAQAHVRARSAPSTRFESLAITRSSTIEEIYRAVLAQDANNLTDTLADPTAHAFTPIIEAVLGARRVYVAGFRGLSLPAGLLACLLDMTGIETTLLTHGNAADFQLARHIGSGDVFLAFVFVRYTKRTLDLARFARSRGAQIVVIADSVTAPAARAADFVLRTAVQTQSFHNSYVGATSIINAIITAISVKSRDRVARALKEVDAVMPDDEFDLV